MLVGGYAVNYHGYIRATVDIDIWIEVSDETATQMEMVIKAFGFGEDALDKALFLNPKQLIQMGEPPFRIDIMMEKPGVRFSECYAARVVTIWDDVEVSVIAKEHLILNKTATGRLKDLADLENLP